MCFRAVLTSSTLLVVLVSAAPAGTAARGRASPAPAAPEAAEPPADGAQGDAGAVVEKVIVELEDRVRRDPEDFVALNKLAGYYLERLRLTGGLENIALAAGAAERSLVALPADFNAGGLAARARARHESHDFAGAREDAAALVRLEPRKASSYQILGDALLELGDYDDAAAAYERMRELDEDGVNTLSRLSRLAWLRGQTDAAREHMEAALEASRGLAPPSPQTVAWCHVQLGEAAFAAGDWEAAEAQYQAALEAEPGGYSALDHLAELRAAQGRHEEAVALYRPVVERVPRPEFFQALGDVYVAAGDVDEAAAWHDRAEEGYLKYAEAGVAHYYHHLAGFYSDVRPDPAKALLWAKKDLEVRHGVYACDAMAWALYQNGQFAEAAGWADKALSLGTKDAHLLYHASMVYYRAGDGRRAKQCLAEAAAANPKFGEFHVHR